MTSLPTHLGSRLASFLAVLAVGAVLGAMGCSATASQSCTLMDCQTAATLSTNLAVPGPTSDLLAVTACRNAVCGTTTVQLSASGQIVKFPASGPGVMLRLLEATEGTSNTNAFIYVYGDNADMKDGDVYRITVVDRTGGATLLDVTTSPARYAKVQPNGAACDREYHCLQTTLEPR